MIRITVETHVPAALLKDFSAADIRTSLQARLMVSDQENLLFAIQSSDLPPEHPEYPAKRYYIEFYSLSPVELETLQQAFKRIKRHSAFMTAVEKETFEQIDKILNDG